MLDRALRTLFVAGAVMGIAITTAALFLRDLPLALAGVALLTLSIGLETRYLFRR